MDDAPSDNNSPHSIHAHISNLCTPPLQPTPDRSACCRWSFTKSMCPYHCSNRAPPPEVQKCRPESGASRGKKMIKYIDYFCMPVLGADGMKKIIKLTIAVAPKWPRRPSLVLTSPDRRSQPVAGRRHACGEWSATSCTSLAEVRRPRFRARRSRSFGAFCNRTHAREPRKADCWCPVPKGLIEASLPPCSIR